jgi:hypothetical protein
VVAYAQEYALMRRNIKEEGVSKRSLGMEEGEEEVEKGM